MPVVGSADLSIDSHGAAPGGAAGGSSSSESGRKRPRRPKSPSGRGQDEHWSRHASRYEEVFIDPYDSRVENPLWRVLDGLTNSKSMTVADLGCGTGPLLPYLAKRFERVIAVDFAPEMIKRAKKRLPPGAKNVQFITAPIHEIADMNLTIDVAVAVNSLVMPELKVLRRSIAAIRSKLSRGGLFCGVAPAMDAIHYQTMLSLEQLIDRGLSEAEAERVVAVRSEHRNYQFAFGRFRHRGLKQKFWMPFELEFRLKKGGFGSVLLDKVLYPWDEAALGDSDFANEARSWDWWFEARA